MIKVYLIRGNRISPKSGICKWHWDCKEHGRGAEFNAKKDAKKNFDEFAKDNKITNYKFVQAV